MNVTLDTNVLLRALLGDDPAQKRAADEIFRKAELISVPIAVLCEFVWVLSHGYKRSTNEICRSMRLLLAIDKVRVDTEAAEAGLAIADRGGDFADGVIAFDGARRGGLLFATFDRNAARLITASGGDAKLLGTG